METQHANLSTMLSVSGALISITNVQPLVTMVASIVAIISGLFAIRYYWKASKKFK